MSESVCLFTVMTAPLEHHEAVLSDVVAPVCREIRGSAEMESLFFARYADREPQVRFRVLGRPDWVRGALRRRIETGLGPLLADGRISRVEFGSYLLELDRYGGPEGMAITEQIYLHDSFAALDLMEAERRGETARSRREYSLVHTEGLLDLFGFDREARRAFYRLGTLAGGDAPPWSPDDRSRLERRFDELRDGLRDLLSGETSRDPEKRYGGREPARISGACLEATRPAIGRLVDAHAAGRIPRDLVHLAWSYAHMHCNRLGIDVVAEAILRYFALRLLEG